MTPLIIYAGEVIACSGLLYSYYLLLLRDSRSHQWNRCYLLSATFLSLLLPLAKIPFIAGSAYGPASLSRYAAELSAAGNHWLKPVTIHAKPGYNYAGLAGAIYILITAILISALIAGYARLIHFIKTHPAGITEKKYKFIYTENENGPYSFFNCIFWNRYIPVDSPEGQQMLQHELAHIRQKHSIDRMLLELISRLAWINPFFWLIKKELEMVHEFSADKRAAERDSQKHLYAELILLQALGARQQDISFSLTNNFFHPPIKRRLQMLISNHQNRFSLLRKAGIAPIAAGILFFFGCQQNNTQDAMAKKADIAKIDAKDIASITLFKEKDQQIVHVKFKTGDSLSMPLNEYEAKLNPPNSVVFLEPPPPPPPVPNAAHAAVAIMQTVTQVASGENKVFTLVEQMPRFPGTINEESSQDKIRQYLGAHIHYPAVARDNGIQGTVYVQFIVAPDGTLRDVKAINSNLGGGLEEEAVKVIKGMPHWIPGEQQGRPVTVQFSIPVKFVLQ